jgi:threonine synthase
VKLVSTGGEGPATDLRTALTRGLAPDGGLYLPERIDPIDPSVLAEVRGQSFSVVSRAVAGHLLGSIIPADDLDRIVDAALDFEVELVPLGDEVSMNGHGATSGAASGPSGGSLHDLYVLELFHGPTLAFKDVGARFMAQLVRYFGDEVGGPVGEAPLTILAATSGDTGSAVAQAFLGIAGIRTVILFPKGKVTPLQERQFTTLGGNVQVLEVDGTFDDCQRLVKSAFSDPILRAYVRLSSANSINIGRLLPQIFYYVYAAAQLPEGSAPLFSVPSGNFGNLTAGLMAKRIGMVSRGFVAATNVNDVVPEHLRTGIFRPRPSIPTISNAMDVGDPSNFARILALYDGDIDRLREDLVGSVHDDDETRECIAQVYRRTGYILDPHSAVAYLGVGAGHRAFGKGPCVVLSTAHPVKFREAVEPAIGSEVPVPDRLAACLDAERHVTPIPAETSALREFLLED